MAGFRRALVNPHRTLRSVFNTASGKERWVVSPSSNPTSKSLLPGPDDWNQSFHTSIVSRFCSSTGLKSHVLDVDFSSEESKRRVLNRLLYRSKQRGFLELDLVLGKWVEDHIHTMDSDGVRALVQVLDLENPDLWKWLTGQEQPPEELKANQVFISVQDKVMKNLNSHASPETRALPGKPWVRGWDDAKKAQESPIAGNQ